MQLIRLLQYIPCRGGRYTFTGSSLPPSWPISMVLFPLSRFSYDAISHLPFSIGSMKSLGRIHFCGRNRVCYFICNHFRSSNTLHMYIYIYIYICVCVCVCVRTHTPKFTSHDIISYQIINSKLLNYYHD